ncbi:hypothetical protein [Nocardia abscessus]|nr:hypothetical protein [Nocardia abscessus]
MPAGDRLDGYVTVLVDLHQPIVDPHPLRYQFAAALDEEIQQSLLAAHR